MFLMVGLDQYSFNTLEALSDLISRNATNIQEHTMVVRNHFQSWVLHSGASFSRISSPDSRRCQW